MPFLLPCSLVRTAPSTQGHIEAAGIIGCIYYWGQGVAVDYKRALAAYKIGAEGGDAHCQYQLGFLLEQGRGIDSPDYEQALVWYEKAAAQDHPKAVSQLAVMYHEGKAVAPSWRRARELFERAIELGSSMAVEYMYMESVEEMEWLRGRVRELDHVPCPLPPLLKFVIFQIDVLY